MTEKIEWYKEVLALEPNSKVFFPLARMLAEVQRVDEAIDVLQKGLSRHEEFLEARLFLIELLHQHQHKDECSEQISKLTKMFSTYAGFWDAWATCLSSAKDDSDKAFALRLLAANFLYGSVSINEILDKGLSALRQKDSSDSSPEDDVISESENVSVPEANIESEDMPSSLADEQTEPEMADINIASEPVNDLLQDESSDEPSVSVQVDEAEADEAVAEFSPSTPADLEESEENFSLRTRSMAEVLAEQGDIKGALDIYHELAAAAVDAEENADLQQRIATLSSHLGSPQLIASDSPAQDLDVSATAKDKLIGILEALAERVEARAHG